MPAQFLYSKKNAPPPGGVASINRILTQNIFNVDIVRVWYVRACAALPSSSLVLSLRVLVRGLNVNECYKKVIGYVHKKITR